jgi:hypothetical protein
MLPKATIEGFTQLPANNYTALMNSIAQVGPVAISVDVRLLIFSISIYLFYLILFVQNISIYLKGINFSFL